MLEKLKDTFKAKELTCSNCNKKIEEGDRFIANITMPSEKDMLVGRLDSVIVRTAESVLCENCK